MTKFLIPVTALAIGLACLSPAAMAKDTTNTKRQTTADLNRAELARINAQPAPAYAEAAPAPREADPTVVYVAGPPHDSTDTTMGIDTSPQSTGTPSTDTPFVAVTPAPTGN